MTLSWLKKEGMMDWDKFKRVFADCELDGNKIILKRVDGEILQEYELKSKN